MGKCFNLHLQIAFQVSGFVPGVNVSVNFSILLLFACVCSIDNIARLIDLSSLIVGQKFFVFIYFNFKNFLAQDLTDTHIVKKNIIHRISLTD